MSMPRSRLEAFYQEFPWLETLIRKDPDLVINVQRIDLDLYKRQRHKKTHMGMFLDEYVYEFIYALDHKGKLLGQVGLEVLPAKNGFLRFLGPKNHEIRGETLEGLLDRLGIDAPLVEFVVSIHGISVTIHKAPKNITVLGYINNEIRKAQEEIKAELAEINKAQEEIKAQLAEINKE